MKRFALLIFFLISLTSWVKKSDAILQVPKKIYEKQELPDFLKPKPEKNITNGQSSLEEALNQDGTLKEGTEGSFNPEGYNMSYGKSGEPIFLPFGAGDERWQSMPDFKGLNGTVYVITVSGINVYVGGRFTDVGNNANADRIAVWNGSNWNALGTGLNNDVTTIAVNGSNVYIGGRFTDAGGNANADYIALWNGTTWNALAGGVNANVGAIAISGSNVYVGGGFTDAGGNSSADRIAVWNGSTWNALGVGVSFGYVFSIAVSGSSIYVGGDFTNAGGNANADYIAVWNASNSTWNALGTGLNNRVYAIAISGSSVYIGGLFTDAGGIASADRIAMWSGSTWYSFGTGLNGAVNSIAVTGSFLTVGGSFTDAGGNANADYVALWSSVWLAPGNSVLSSEVYTIATSGGNTYAGGSFTDAGGIANADYIAVLRGSTWSALSTGVNVFVNAIAVSGNNVYVGGYFTDAGGNANADRIAVWNGSSWNNLGTGVNNGGVNAIAVSGSNVYVGGVFTDAGGNTNADRIAVWNGSLWTALGAGLNNSVSDIAVSGSNVYVSGDFTDAGSNVNADRIAVWNGSSWNGLGTGVSNGVVNAICINAGNVYVGGAFTDAGGNTNADAIAVWNGSLWNALGSGLNNQVLDIAVSGSNLYVGGNFTDAGGIANADRIAVWNGSSWNSLGTGVNDGGVNIIVVSGNNVYVGGAFTDAGGNTNADGIAVWNGSLWNALGTGLNSNVSAIAVTGSNVYVGGFFSATNDGSVSANYLIQRNGVFPSAVPSVAEQAAPSTPKEVLFKGTVRPGGLSGTYYFQYGTISGNLNQVTNPENMSGSIDQMVNAKVTSETANAILYYRLRVENAEGVSYSEIQSYTFPPDIVVKQAGNTLTSGGEYDFGSIAYQSSSAGLSFSLHNEGLGNLTLTGLASSYIVKGGTNPADFTVSQSSLTSPISYTSNKPFTVQFNPTSGGVRTATLTIGSNDPDQATYVINLKGMGTKLDQIITFNALPTKVFGDAAFSLTATTSSPLAVSYSSSNTAVATISGTTLTITGPGTSVITALQAGNANYNAAPSVQQTLTVRAVDPTSQPTGATFNAITTTSMNCSFTAATSSPAGYIVLRGAGASPTDIPEDGTPYLLGDNIGSSIVAYVGSSISFPNTGLTPATVYHYDVFAYNGSGASINYRTASPLEGSQTTLSLEPLVQPTLLTFSSVTETSMNFSFTASSSVPSGYLILRKENSAPTEVPVDGVTYSDMFGTSKVVNAGPATSYTGGSYLPGTVYHFTIYAYNGSGASINYLTSSPLSGSRTTLAVSPTSQATDFVFNTVTATSLNASFTPATGSPTGYLVLRKAGSVSTDVPVDGLAYTTIVGSTDVVQAGSTTTFSNVNLTGGTTYHYTIYAYNGSGQSLNYYTTAPMERAVLMLPPAPLALDAVNPLTNSFKAKWSETLSAVSYELDVSLSQSFESFITGYQGKSINSLEETITGLTPDKTYYYRVRAKNASGLSANSNSISVTTPKDFNTLPLTVSSLTQVAEGANNRVSFTVSGGSGVRVVKFFSRGILSSGAFNEVNLTSTTNDFSSVITPQQLDNIGLEFYFSASDAVTTTPIVSNRGYIYKPTPANTKIADLSFGGDIKNYRMFSIPYQLENNTVQNLFGLLGGVDKTKWRLIRYANGDNQNYPQFSTIDLGKAYWFNAREAIDINVGNGTVARYNQNNSFTLSLEQGWNQIGNPFPFNISWSALQAANPGKVGNLKVFAPETVSFVESPTLHVWSGGFAFAEQATDIVFPLLDLSATSPSSRSTETYNTTQANNFSTEEWYLPLTLEQSGVTNTLLGVGMHPEASLSKDELDEVTLPRFIQYLEMGTQHQEYFVPLFSKDVVPSANQHVWEFTLNTNVSTEPVTLHWDPSWFSDAAIELLLYDPEGQSFIDMHSQSSYTFSVAANRKLRLYYSTTDEPLATNFTTLLDPAPNPTEESTTLTVVLKERSTIMLNIYDLQGRIVKTLKQGEEEQGIHTYHWNGAGDKGLRLPQGIYLAQLSVGNIRQIKRVLLN